MSTARIEEVEDDDDSEVEEIGDPDEMDLDAFDFARPQGNLQQSVMDPSQMNPESMQEIFQQAQQQPQNQPSQTPRPPMTDKERERLEREHHDRTKNYQCIYPLYFDISRSREQGRRVKKSAAVSNPLARELVDALQHIGNTLNVGLQVVFEPTKTHPKDWANPGRVRVLVKEDGKAVSKKVGSKHYLYTLIAAYLQSHPTTPRTALKYRLHGMPPPKNDEVLPPAVPRGFKIGSILPLHSPALSGGGVSDNFLKDMLAESGGQLPPGMEGLAGMANAVGGGAGGAGQGGGKQKVKVQRIRR